MPNWKIPSGDPSQPHIVQLAGILCDADSKAVIMGMDLIIKPEGYEIPEEMTEIHGISNEMAMDVGVPEKLAVETLLAMCGNADRCAYNKTFDQRIIRIALKRFFSDEGLMDRWATKEDHHDTMRMAQKVFGGKVMKLSEAYLKVTGVEFEGAHTAIMDTLACMELYFELKDREELK